MVEYSTVDTAAQPFKRPAFDQTKKQALKIDFEDLDQFIESEAKKANKKIASGKVKV